VRAIEHTLRKFGILLHDYDCFVGRQKLEAIVRNRSVGKGTNAGFVGAAAREATSSLRNWFTLVAMAAFATDELAGLLGKRLGVEISAGGVANKISRGGFGAAFLLQCMEALGINLAPLPK